MTLKAICSWCKRVLREGDAPAGAPETADCCRPCAKKHFPLIYDEIEASLPPEEPAAPPKELS